ncbi:hypothetical protein CFOL_v3_17114 [Cephalotus follicularis]|uniref:Zf-RVT domain-containing protein n=1 Tax=Cephalotus follicularis TaxID=3775 RepID=A0A1Q3C0H3_CEPFO|nr:hypothetical protein CFOL_v3_17114 [Cephalotus follicularis]
MLAKQGWRLINDEDSLCSRVLKATYFWNRNFLEAPQGYNLSFTWSSLYEVREVLKNGLKWSADNGIKTEIWKDNWVPMREPLTPAPSNVLDHNARVSQMIVWDNGEWDHELIRQCFDDATVQAIIWIPLSHRLCADILIWSKHSTENYMVKSGYRLANGIVNGVAIENVIVPIR